MSKFEVTQEHGKCIGCGQCMSVCPANWEMGSDGKSHPKKKIDTSPCNLEAEKHCPVQCIHIKKL